MVLSGRCNRPMPNNFCRRATSPTRAAIVALILRGVFLSKKPEKSTTRCVLHHNPGYFAWRDFRVPKKRKSRRGCWMFSTLLAHIIVHHARITHSTQFLNRELFWSRIVWHSWLILVIFSCHMALHCWNSNERKIGHFFYWLIRCQFVPWFVQFIVVCNGKWRLDWDLLKFLSRLHSYSVQFAKMYPFRVSEV